MNTLQRTKLLIYSTFLLMAYTAQAQEIDWAIAGQGFLMDRGTAVSTDDNYIYNAGILGGEVTFGVGQPWETDVDDANYIARFNHDGTLSWVSTIASDGSSLIISAMDNDPAGNVFITGRISTGNFFTFGDGEPNETTIQTNGNANDAFLAKYAADGSFAWVRQAGINEVNSANDVVADAAGNSYITGSYRSHIIFGEEGTTPAIDLFSEGGDLDNDLFIVKYDPNGDLVWARSAGGVGGSDTGFGIDLDDKNNIFLIGHFLDDITFGRDTKHEISLTGEGFFDGFVARFSPKGFPIWAVNNGGTEADGGLDIVVQNGKSLVIGGFNDMATIGSTDGAVQVVDDALFRNYYVARYNRRGELLWVNVMFMDDSPTVRVGYGDNQQSCVMGSFMGTALIGAGFPDAVLFAPADRDMFFTCYSGQGVFQWAESDPAPLEDATMNGDGEIIATGGFTDGTAFGPGDPSSTAFISEGQQDIFLAKYISAPKELGLTTDKVEAMDVLRISDAVPDAYALDDNYPNPFNPQTTIRFALPEAAAVTLVVYDVSGRAVETLIDGALAEGHHEVQFDARDLPSGLYLYRLTTPKGSFAQTMSLIK